MNIVIKEISSKNDIKRFIRFQVEHYKGNNYFVPPIINDEIETFSKDKNPAFVEIDAKLFVALIDNKIVGRIVAINNLPANRKYGTKNIRFGWFESIDNYEVAKLLFDEVKKYAISLDMQTITGPHGFCDFDPQGMLVEGFDKLGTIAGIYNYKYYNDFVTKYGFQKDIDYVEFLSEPPYSDGIPQKMLDMAEWAKKRYGYKLIQYGKSKDYLKHGKEVFQLLNETFEDNYGTVPLSNNQIEYYIKKYFTFIHKDLIKLVADADNNIIGFLITMPNLSSAYQKSKGHLLPFGAFHLLRAMKTFNILDFYLAGVKREFRGKGVDLVMIVEIVKTAMKMGFKYAESNQELENNSKVHSEWKFFKPILHKRRRIYKLYL